MPTVDDFMALVAAVMLTKLAPDTTEFVITEADVQAVTRNYAVRHRRDETIRGWRIAISEKPAAGQGVLPGLPQPR